MRYVTVGLCVGWWLAGAMGAGAMEIFAPNPLVTVFENQKASSNLNPNVEIRIVGTRNGSFCGQVVFHDNQPFKGEIAAMSDLKGKTGNIPASLVKVAYAYPTMGRGALDALLETPRASGKTHAVWITVKIPADANPGDYEGSLTVGTNGVPVKLKVMGWVMPEPHDFFLHAGLIESPETVALQYQKELWSDEHFRLIGKSFEQLGRIGNKTIYIPLIARTNFGNEQSLVRWIRDDPSGTVATTNVVQPGDKFKHDFTIAEKYLDLFLEKVGKPKVVCLYMWEVYAGGGYFGKNNAKLIGEPVSLLDPESKKISNLRSPPFGTPESEAFWPPVLDGLHERLGKRGLGDETIMVGIAGDVRPNKTVTDEIKKMVPYARWVLHSHGKAYELNGVKIGYISHVWGVGGPPPGWKQDWQYTDFPREGVAMPLRSVDPSGAFRMIGEHGLLTGLRGFGRVGADFWNVLGDKGKRSLIARYPETSWNQLNVNSATVDMLYPGPDGAVSTVRFEMMREGIQECEARIFIERKLLDKALRVKLGDELAKKAEGVLAERAEFITDALGRRTPQKQPAKGWVWYAGESDWQGRSEKLYAVADEVAVAMGSK